MGISISILQLAFEFYLDWHCIFFYRILLASAKAHFIQRKARVIGTPTQSRQIKQASYASNLAAISINTGPSILPETYCLLPGDGIGTHCRWRHVIGAARLPRQVWRRAHPLPTWHRSTMRRGQPQ